MNKVVHYLTLTSLKNQINKGAKRPNQQVYADYECATKKEPEATR